MVKEKEEKNSIATIEAEIRKKYGDIMVPADALLGTEGEIVNTTLSLDIALSGGIPEGAIVTMTSPPKAGKTTTCLTIIANAQRKFKKECFYIDVENRIRTDLLKTIPGLIWTKEQEKETGIPRLQIIRSTEETFLTAEKYLSIVEGLLKSKKQCIIVLDSIAALCSEHQWASEIGEKKVMDIPALMYSFMRKIAQIIAVNKSIFIGITHLQSSPNAYKPLVAVGGNAQEFFASVRLVCFSAQEQEKDGIKVGKNPIFKITASSLGPPGGEATVYIRYGRGCDNEEDIAHVAEEMGFLSKSGAWYTLALEGHEPNKVQGIDKIVQNLKDNPKLKDDLENAIRKLAFGGKHENGTSGKK